MKASQFSLFASCVLLLTACSSGVDEAKQEMTAACVSSGGGQLTEDECACITDGAFAELSDEERKFMGATALTDRDITPSELADELGMTIPEMDAKGQSILRKMGAARMRVTMECVG